MKEALSQALGDREGGARSDEPSVDRILAAAFFRTRPLQAGTTPVADLSARRAATKSL